MQCVAWQASENAGSPPQRRQAGPSQLRHSGRRQSAHGTAGMRRRRGNCEAASPTAAPRNNCQAGAGRPAPRSATGTHEVDADGGDVAFRVRVVLRSPERERARFQTCARKPKALFLGRCVAPLPLERLAAHRKTQQQARLAHTAVSDELNASVSWLAQRCAEPSARRPTRTAAAVAAAAGELRRHATAEARAAAAGTRQQLEEVVVLR